MNLPLVHAAVSLLFLLLFSELSAANFKRLAPVLEAWEHSRLALAEWRGGWEKMAALCWAVGMAIPLLAFTMACNFFLSDHQIASTLVIGASIGSNVIALSLCFGILMALGPMSFFRIRTITSPVFLLLATLAFTFTCLDGQISRVEGTVLLVLAVAYGFYFRRFSSEWKYYERTHAGPNLLQAAEGMLPVVAVFCLGLGFFMLAVLAGYPFVQYMNSLAEAGRISDSRLAVHIAALLLSSPWVLRTLLAEETNDSARSMALTGLTHTALLNMLFLPGLVGLAFVPAASPRLIAVDLPVLLIFTGVFVCTLLVEKEKGGGLTYVLILSYLLYTGLGVFL